MSASQYEKPPPGCPARTAAEFAAPTRSAHAAILRLSPEPCPIAVFTPAWNFSKMRGTPAMNVGRIATRSSLIIAVPRENAVSQPIWIVHHSSSRPSTWASGRNRYCTSIVYDLHRADRAEMPAVRFSCVSTTPLGTPVVPDV